MAVSVQRLTVPDLVVVDQPSAQLLANQPPPVQLARSTADPLGSHHTRTTQSISSSQNNLTQQQPEAASLINFQDLNGSGSNTISNHEQQQQQLTFECLISYDRKKDKNLIIKWHHDDRVEPIYQWIVELDKISIAPQYKPYILANNFTSQPRLLQQQQQMHLDWQRTAAGNSTAPVNSNQIQLLEAGFRLIKPSKELGAPPRSFKFNATRTDFGQSERLSSRDSWPAKQTTNLLQHHQSVATNEQLPLAYRSRGFDGQPASTISPQMYKNIDYVNVNPNYRPSSRPADPVAHLSGGGGGYTDLWQSRRPMTTANGLNGASSGVRQSTAATSYTGVKLVCDIDQIFPVPEVSIYRLAKLNGSHPDKLTKSETKIEKNPLNGLYHIQVISVLLDDEIETKYGFSEPVYFECLIALTNLELSKYSDNKRSLVYRPNVAALSQQQRQDLDLHINMRQNFERSSANASQTGWSLVHVPLLMMNFLLLLIVNFSSSTATSFLR